MKNRKQIEDNENQEIGRGTMHIFHDSCSQESVLTNKHYSAANSSLGWLRVEKEKQIK